ncbi:hypothetical protein [Ekhidna sp.]|uniref:hypothetical protein n=1 Tax=Ekhidna sp. TaxID=2608089 RepID=UPI0032987FE0
MDTSTRILSFIFLFVSLATSAQLAFEGSSESVKSDKVVKDITAPRTDLLRTEAGEFIYGPATRIKFKIIEEESGIATTNFKIADLPYMKSDGRQMVPHQLSDGVYRMEYYSVDKEGNQEQIRVDKIYIDKIGPKVSAGFNSSPSSFENGLPIFSSDIQLVVEAVDEQVKVQKLTYKINNGPIVKSNNAEFIDLTEELRKINSELIKIEIYAYDTFYNLSKEVVEFKIMK